jgi:hypothetical protein
MLSTQLQRHCIVVDARWKLLVRSAPLAGVLVMNLDKTNVKIQSKSKPKSLALLARQVTPPHKRFNRSSILMWYIKHTMQV